MSMPNEEKMRGNQSMNVMWMGGSDPFRDDLEKTAASRRTKKARENCVMYTLEGGS